jgi:Spy/CpxP family protein refolding chaperone
MKKTINLAILLLLISHLLTAQNNPNKGQQNGERREKMASMKIGYITNKLNLSPSEAQQFWPVYNEYENKLETIRKNRKKDKEEGGVNLELMSDKDLEAYIDNEMLQKQKEIELMKEYNTKFKSVLPIRKVAMFYQAQEDFKRELLKKIKEKKDEGPR